MTSLTTGSISEAARFAELEGEWDGLVLRSSRPAPFALHAWLAAWWASFGPDLRCITVRRDGELVGGLAIEILRRGPVRVGRLAGALALGDVLAAPADAAAVAGEIAAAIARLSVDVVDFDYIARGSVLATHLPGPLRLAEAIAAPTLDLADGFDASYQRAAGSGTRRTHRRRLKQLQEQGDVTFASHRTEAEIGAALGDAFRLHALRWAGQRDTSPFGTPAGQAFHRAALAALSRSDHVRLLELRLDGVPIAFQLYLLAGGAMFTYRLAFDPAYARFSPGALTMVEAIRRGAAEGAARAEFLRGDEPYKLAVADTAEPLVRLVGLPSGLRGRAYMESVAAGAGLRARLRGNDHLRRAVRRTRDALPRRR